MADDPRSCALEIFQDVVRRRQPMDAALSSHAEMAHLPPAGQAFARRLVITTLKRLGQIDDLLSYCMERPLPTKARIVQDILRLGVAQILFTEVPDHAAVDTSVRLFREKGEGGYAKLINAVLRRLTREGEVWLETQDTVRLNTPDWLWQSWCDAYGETACRAIGQANAEEPPLDISVKTDPHSWAERLGGQALPGGTVRLRGAGAVSALEGYDEGAWWVQDVAAHLVSCLIGDVAGKKVIDLCAAPGGKTAAMVSAGANVIAVDRSRNRLRRLQENLLRLSLSAEIVETDAVLWRPDDLVDAVLLDAPCSATGTLRRHPDIAYGKSQADIIKLAALQKQLLLAATEMLKPGGTLIFATCSLQSEEGPGQVMKALERGLPLKVVPLCNDDVFGLDEVIDAEGHFRSLPAHLGTQGHMDGFFACRFERL